MWPSRIISPPSFEPTTIVLAARVRPPLRARPDRPRRAAIERDRQRSRASAGRATVARASGRAAVPARRGRRRRPGPAGRRGSRRGGSAGGRESTAPVDVAAQPLGADRTRRSWPCRPPPPPRPAPRPGSPARPAASSTSRSRCQRRHPHPRGRLGHAAVDRPEAQDRVLDDRQERRRSPGPPAPGACRSRRGRAISRSPSNARLGTVWRTLARPRIDRSAARDRDGEHAQRDRRSPTAISDRLDDQVEVGRGRGQQVRAVAHGEAPGLGQQSASRPSGRPSAIGRRPRRRRRTTGRSRSAGWSRKSAVGPTWTILPSSIRAMPVGDPRGLADVVRDEDHGRAQPRCEGRGTRPGSRGG